MSLCSNLPNLEATSGCGGWRVPRPIRKGAYYMHIGTTEGAFPAIVVAKNG